MAPSLVELGPLADPGLLPSALARGVGVLEEPHRPLMDTLCERLQGRQLLIVLDNCEHVIDAPRRGRRLCSERARASLSSPPAGNRSTFPGSGPTAYLR